MLKVRVLDEKAGIDQEFAIKADFLDDGKSLVEKVGHAMECPIAWTEEQADMMDTGASIIQTDEITGDTRKIIINWADRLTMPATITITKEHTFKVTQRVVLAVVVTVTAENHEAASDSRGGVKRGAGGQIFLSKNTLIYHTTSCTYKACIRDSDIVYE